MQPTHATAPLVYPAAVLPRAPVPAAPALATTVPVEDSDEVLMDRYCAGDEQAFRRLFARHGGRVYCYLLQCAGSRALAEDLSQQTWLHVHRGRASFQAGHRFLPWLYTIAANLRRDSARRSRRRPEELTLDGDAPMVASEAEPPALAERAAAVRQALLELPDDHREVIVLHRWHDLGFAEIAAVLGTTEGAIKVRAHRGYVRLRALLAGRGLP